MAVLAKIAAANFVPGLVVNLIDLVTYGNSKKLVIVVSVIFPLNFRYKSNSLQEISV
jgi:hypothetical protein